MSNYSRTKWFSTYIIGGHLLLYIMCWGFCSLLFCFPCVLGLCFYYACVLGFCVFDFLSRLYAALLFFTSLVCWAFALLFFSLAYVFRFCRFLFAPRLYTELLFFFCLFGPLSFWGFAFCLFCFACVLVYIN